MSQSFQVAEHDVSTPPYQLPSLATPTEIRSLLFFLGKAPSGVTIDQLGELLKRQIADQSKISACEALGIISRSHDRIHLTANGLQLSEAIGPEITGFRSLIHKYVPYRALLQWAHDQEFDSLLHSDAVDYWFEHHRDAVGMASDKMFAGFTTCFFQLCQAAALGAFISGRKGQPTRLRFYKDELSDLLSAVYPETGTVESADSAGVDYRVSSPISMTQRFGTRSPGPDTKEARVFLSYSRDIELASKLSSALEVAGLSVELVQRTVTDGAPIPGHMAESMRNCGAALLMLSSEDLQLLPDEGLTLKVHTQSELSAAYVLYGHRLMIVCPSSLALPSNVEGLNQFRYSEGEMTLDAGLRLIVAARSLFTD
jgi:TIR domain